MNKLLGIDHGKKRIGLALAETKIAFPYRTIENNKFVFRELEKICQEEKIEKIIIGFPLTLSSERKEQAREVLSFRKELEKKLKILTVIEDERFTSKIVDKLMNDYKGKVDRDALSAMLILQSYLDK